MLPPSNTSPATVRPLLRLLVGALVPVCLAQAHGGRPHPDPLRGARGTSRPDSLPYLLAGPPPPLRFAAAVPISWPPPPALVEEIDATNHDAAVNPDQSPPPDAAPPVSAPQGGAITTPPEPAVPPAPNPADTAAPPVGGGVSILPDDTPRGIRAEDVLPFFRFPGTAPPLPPPSSATFQQR